MSFNIEKQSLVCQLYHRTKHNNSVNVVCELSEKIGSPHRENGEWVVKCDITGLNAKKSKMVKIHFHPSVAQLSSEDPDLHEAACDSALKYLDVLLEDSVWTRRSNQDDHLLDKQVQRLVEILVDMDKVVEINNAQIGLSFLHNEHFDELLKLVTCKSVASHLHTNIVDDGEHQTVEMMFTQKNKTSRRLIRLALDSGYLDASDSGKECLFESSKSCFTWNLTRANDDVENSPPNVSQKLDCFLSINGHEQEMPVYSPCASVFHHLDKLTTSLNSSSAGSASTNGVLQRVPQALAVDAIIGLDKSEASQLHKFIQTITQAPLTIHTDCEEVYSDSECKFTISPTDSVDSGVSLSSPTRQTSFDDDDGDDEDSCSSPGVRSRSRSESCSSLKGILKWPVRNRLQLKPHLMRSYSECQHDDSKYPVMMPLRFSEDDEDAFHEEDSSDCCVLPAAATRKKSVSFSERIEQTRLFNSNTSINAQKRKNLKKNEKKKKRENSLASSIESIHEESSGRVTRHPTV